MKFNNGYWKLKDGVEQIAAMRVADARADENSLTLFCAATAAEGRSTTINAPLLTVEFTCPADGVIMVRAYHHKGAVPRGPRLQLRAQTGLFDYSLSEGFFRVTSGELRAEITSSPYSCTFYFRGKRMTGSPAKGLSFYNTPDGAFMSEQLGIDVAECIYGLGERFTPFVKNGQCVDMWNEDGGTASEIAYKNIPFYISSRGYGVFVADSGRVSFEVGSEVVSRVRFSAPGQELCYCVVGGSDMKSVVTRYCGLTGRPALPPAWSFGLWLTTSFTTDYDEATVTGFIDGMGQRGIPLHVFHFDCFWMKEYEWCNFTWDERQFPDPAGFLARLKQRGLKICCWINPYIAQKSPMFDEGMENGYLLKRPNGDVWQTDMWQAGMGLVDFTNPDATAWYLGKLKALLDVGVDCFKTDFGERIPTDVAYFDGSDPVRMHNYYTHLYNKAVFGLLEAERGKGNALVFARSGTAGGQQYPVHWGGDNSSNYYSMAESLRGGLSLMSSGYGFWSNDISGFEQTATPDLYKRWVAFGLLCTHSRLHGSKSYRVPWLFDDEACEVLKFFTNLKCKLMPYIFSEACRCTETGVPVMRPMAMEFPDDPACAYLDRQYMLGSNLLVAPVMSEDGYVSYYLPDGKWTHLLSNEIKRGGRWYREHYDYFSLPLFAREHSILPIGWNDKDASYDFERGVTFHVFEPRLSEQCECQVYSPEGRKSITCKVTRLKGDYKVSMASPHYDFALLFRNMHDKTAIRADKVEDTPKGLRVRP